MPAFNEGKLIAEVITKIKENGYKNIIVVDDGSPDTTYEEAKKSNVIVLHHAINRGPGAAIQTGLDAAKILNAPITVTIDSDGQHQPKDIDTLVEPILLGQADVCLGSRFLTTQKIPFLKVIANKVGNFLTYIFYGIYVTDSQSGFRALSNKALNGINMTMDRYEFASEMLQQIKSGGFKYKEFPIDVLYTKYSKTRFNNIKTLDFTKQDIFNGFRMLYKMIIRSLFT